MKFYDFMEAVVPIIKKPWHEDGNDNLLLNRAGKNNTRRTDRINSSFDILEMSKHGNPENVSSYILRT